MEIIEVKELHGKRKRFSITISEYGKIKKYQFGQPNGFTYIDGASNITRNNYLSRHMANETEADLINNLTPSPALFSAAILWGNSPNIEKNIKELNKAFKKISGIEN